MALVETEMSWRLASALIFLVGIAAQLVNAAEPNFGPSPRLAITAAEGESLRKSSDYERQKAEAIRAGVEALAKHLEVPRGPGNWIFYYACPADGTTLTPLSDTEHRCGKCGKTYSDERTIEANRTRLHYQVDRGALVLAWAWWHTRDERFAAEVRRLLVRLADEYPNYPQRRDRWSRSGIFATIGGRRYIQSLDEAVAVIDLAKAYDLTRDGAVWTDDDRRHVEQDLFRAIAATLSWWNSGRNNHQTWYNAGLIAVGSVLADRDLVAKAIDGRFGFHEQLERSVGDDGLWYEGAMAYHNYALQAMIEIVDAGRRLGLPLHDEPRFKSMITGPLDAVYPNGQFPAINDSDPANIASFDRHFAWAWKAYNNPRFAQAYARDDAKRLAQLTGSETLKLEPWEPKSKNLTGVGLAVLRRGHGADAACAMLDYGQHGDAHGHFDKLNIVLYANGREWLLDPGRLTYSHAEYKTWVKETVAHNTVTLAGASQAPTTGELLLFDEQPDYIACIGRTREAYHGATLTRTLVLTDTLLIDRFDVTSPAATQIDWHAHAQCRELVLLDDLPAVEPAAPGTAHGYQHLQNGVMRQVAGPTRWAFRDGNQKQLTLWIADQGPQQIYQSVGIGYHTHQAAPCLTRRTSAAGTTFWTVYELFPERRELQSVSVKGGQVLQVETLRGRWEATFDRGKVQCRQTRLP